MHAANKKPTRTLWKLSSGLYCLFQSGDLNWATIRCKGVRRSCDRTLACFASLASHWFTYLCLWVQRTPHLELEHCVMWKRQRETISKRHYNSESTYKPSEQTVKLSDRFVQCNKCGLREHHSNAHVYISIIKKIDSPMRNSVMMRALWCLWWRWWWRRSWQWWWYYWLLTIDSNHTTHKHERTMQTINIESRQYCPDLLISTSTFSSR